MMRQLFYILLLMSLLVSCDKEVSTPQENEESHIVTFNLSGMENSFSSSFTRASGKQSIDFAKFDVMFYLFEQVDATDDYKLVEMNPITGSIFKMTVKKGVSYKYVVAAAKKTGTTTNLLVVAKDFYTSYTEVESASINTSLLNNCFFDICGDRAYTGGEEVSMNSNPEIFADGFNLVTSFDFHTPVDIVLKRQVGAVEFKLTGLTPGEHTFKCSIPSDYYRLYLSQIVREDATKDYSSQNSGVNSDLYDYGIEAGDYYGKIANANSVSDLLYFTKEETVTTTADSHNFYIYMPYTIASTGISTTSLYYGGNANGSEELNIDGGLTLIVDGISHSYDKPFPIYRNKKSYFLLKGDNELECKLGNIELGDDSWNGQ